MLEPRGIPPAHSSTSGSVEASTRSAGYVKNIVYGVVPSALKTCTIRRLMVGSATRKTVLARRQCRPERSGRHHQRRELSAAREAQGRSARSSRQIDWRGGAGRIMTRDGNDVLWKSENDFHRTWKSR